MNKVIGWIVCILDLIIGAVLFLAAQIEISTNSRYTFRKPLTNYETQVITMKWCGVIFLVSGIVWLIIKIFQSAYVNKHVQENMNNGAMYQKATICPGCGLQVASSAVPCPRCGFVFNMNSNPNMNINPVRNQYPNSPYSNVQYTNAYTDQSQQPNTPGKSEAGFCGNCGSPVVAGHLFCSNCGNKIG